MKGLLVSLTVALCVFSLAGNAAAGGGRTETVDYISDGVFVAGHGNLAGQGHHLAIPPDSAPITFDPHSGERWLRIEVADDAAPVTVVLVSQAVHGAHHENEIEFCGPAHAFELHGDQPVEVRIFSGFCANHDTGIATTGTITATFSR